MPSASRCCGASRWRRKWRRTSRLIEERDATALLGEARDEMLNAARSGADTPLRQALDTVVARMLEGRLNDLMKELFSRRARFERLIESAEMPAIRAALRRDAGRRRGGDARVGPGRSGDGRCVQSDRFCAARRMRWPRARRPTRNAPKSCEAGWSRCIASVQRRSTTIAALFFTQEGTIAKTAGDQGRGEGLARCGDLPERRGGAPRRDPRAAARGRSGHRHRGADPCQRRRAPALHPAQGGGGAAGLRGSDPEDGRPAAAAGHRAVGALQAGRRHRPRADRRGAGHQPGAVAGDRRADRGVLRRARHLGESALDLRGRRPQAVDLLVPGRGAG